MEYKCIIKPDARIIDGLLCIHDPCIIKVPDGTPPPKICPYNGRLRTWESLKGD